MKKLIILLSVLLPAIGWTQTPPEAKFGKVSLAELEQKTYAVDPEANAVVLYDIASTQIVGNRKGWFSLEFKRKKRVHILNKNGYDEAAIEIPVYRLDDLEEQLQDLKAATYNAENGKVVEVKLDKSALYSEKKNKHVVVKKFAFPSVKEGSIIEFEYKLVSDFLFNLQPWSFQSEIPHLWSEYKVSIPQFLKYILISQGDQQYTVSDQKSSMTTYGVNVVREAGLSKIDELIQVSCGKTDFRWAIHNVPALKKEVYTTATDNYVKKLEFQLAGYLEPLEPTNIMTNWPDVIKKLNERDDFGKQLENPNNWLGSTVDDLVKNKTVETEKAKAIFEYIRDNFTCKTQYQLYTDNSLKEIFKSKSGGVAEINLLLVAMLRNAGLSADPVILSTVENGLVYPKYPVLSRFNYVIAQVKLDSDNVLLDASNPLIGFGKLPANVYNGQCRIINGTGDELKLMPEQITEQENVFIQLMNEGNTWKGKIQHGNGYYESLRIRNEVAKNGEEKFFKDLQSQITTKAVISDGKIDSLKVYEKPVKTSYEISFNSDGSDIIYLNPILIGNYQTNPFKSTSRNYPVELPYKSNWQYIINIPVPSGYTVDEMPKPVLLKMDNSNDVVFDYKISKSGDMINLRTKLEINRTRFEPAEYNLLREFFGMVAARQAEQIVFKKK